MVTLLHGKFFPHYRCSTNTATIFSRACRYDDGGAAAGVTTLTSGSGSAGGRSDRRITLAMIKDEGLGSAGAQAWVQVGCPFPKHQMLAR